MEESGEKVGEKPLPTKFNGFAIDLVRKSMGINNSPLGEVVELNGNARLEDNEGEIELSLGLSLNGKFGVDPKRAQLKLIRASSVSTLTLNGEENQGHEEEVQVGVEAPPLIRTCSLPCVMEEELRKRKEFQSARRVEAKRRRMDKLRFSKEGREKVDTGSDIGSVCSNGDGAKTVLQGSELGSQGSGGSSGISELESNSIKDNLNNDAKFPHNITHSQPEHELNVPINAGKSNIRFRHCRVDHKPPIAPRDKPSSVVATVTKKETMQLDGFKNNMPFVSTKDKGPDGKRMEGFLYRYQKGEVKIVCVCHGSVFSPAEFVRHGGGGDVEHPLRHIVVGSRPFL